MFSWRDSIPLCVFMPDRWFAVFEAEQKTPFFGPGLRILDQVRFSLSPENPFDS
jgi:hypothetical protein